MLAAYSLKSDFNTYQILLKNNRIKIYDDDIFSPMSLNSVVGREIDPSYFPKNFIIQRYPSYSEYLNGAKVIKAYYINGGIKKTFYILNNGVAFYITHISGTLFVEAGLLKTMEQSLEEMGFIRSPQLL